MRAARLRAEGEAALNRHLAAEVGRVHRVLTESPRMGRTETFTEVAFATDQAEGRIVDASVRGHDGRMLLA